MPGQQRHPAFDERVDARIVAAIDRELESRGLTKLASGSPDVVVAYGSLTRTDIDLKSKTSDGVSRQYAVGTLVVELSDATSRQPLYQSPDRYAYQRDPAALDAVIDTAVKSLFEKYPAQPQQAQSQQGSGSPRRSSRPGSTSKDAGVSSRSKCGPPGPRRSCGGLRSLDVRRLRQPAHGDPDRSGRVGPAAGRRDRGARRRHLERRAGRDRSAAPHAHLFHRRAAFLRT